MKKRISNIEQGILNVEGVKNNEGLNQARQHFDIGHSLFPVRYSLKISTLDIPCSLFDIPLKFRHWTFLVPCSIFFFQL